MNAVLQEIGAQQQQHLLVYNKIDVLQGVKAHTDVDEEGKPVRVWVSAVNGEGLPELYEAISVLLHEHRWQGCIKLTPGNNSQLRAQLFALNAIKQEVYDDEGYCFLDIMITDRERKKLGKKVGGRF